MRRPDGPASFLTLTTAEPLSILCMSAARSRGEQKREENRKKRNERIRKARFDDANTTSPAGTEQQRMFRSWHPKHLSRLRRGACRQQWCLAGYHSEEDPGEMLSSVMLTYCKVGWAPMVEVGSRDFATAAIGYLRCLSPAVK